MPKTLVDTLEATKGLIFRILFNRQSCIEFTSGARMRLLANQSRTARRSEDAAVGSVMMNVLLPEPFVSPVREM
jgi:hypothetical protein